MVNFLHFLQKGQKQDIYCAGINTVLQNHLCLPCFRGILLVLAPVLQCSLYGQEVLPHGLTELKLYLDHAVESTWLLLNTDELPFICI